ncbi:hypothetical protein CDAR_102191 [Caerostris darwini]|uniref:Uncharacterized protein n=1 Tax=Caerostris darwini TaxID=1538125 RepID=A0AAV4RNH8_9ARAC|nr:hypothetical protein CDAR_102191 [Caerostris darwini]
MRSKKFVRRLVMMGWNLSGRCSNSSKNVTLFSRYFTAKTQLKSWKKFTKHFFGFLRYAPDSRFVGKKIEEREKNDFSVRWPAKKRKKEKDEWKEIKRVTLKELCQK